MLRRSPRALALWSAAGVLAVSSAALVASGLATLARDTRDLGPERPAVVATRDLVLGTTLSAGDVSTRQVHAAQLPPGVLRDADAVVGRVIALSVIAGGFVTARNLVPPGRSGLDGLLPAGMRATRVVVHDSLVPARGDVVDVLASFDASTRTSAGSGIAGAVVVASGVLVLDVDHARSTSDGTGVTLLVTPDEARDLAAAATHGVVTLVLAPPEASATPAGAAAAPR